MKEDMYYLDEGNAYPFHFGVKNRKEFNKKYEKNIN